MPPEVRMVCPPVGAIGGWGYGVAGQIIIGGSFKSITEVTI